MSSFEAVTSGSCFSTAPKGQELDLIVAQQVAVELKSVSKLPEVAVAQTLSYLKATGLKRGL